MLHSGWGKMPHSGLNQNKHMEYNFLLFGPIADGLSHDSVQLSVDTTASDSTMVLPENRDAIEVTNEAFLYGALGFSMLINIILLLVLLKKKFTNQKTLVMSKKCTIKEPAKPIEHASLPPEKPVAATPVIEKSHVFSEAQTKAYSVCGISIQGTGHLDEKTPCQDYHQIEILDNKNNIGIAIVSDGAGSAKNSAEGAQMVCEYVIKYLKIAIEKFGWMHTKNRPDATLWEQVVRETIRLTQIELNAYANSKNYPFKSLAATCMFIFFTPEKSYFAHVGDGRAGVKTKDGWKAILTPHKGEEANQTVFVTNEILKPEDLLISGVRVPETLVIESPIEAFVLMSDGCEDGLWEKNEKEDLPDGDFRYIARNKPFVPALEKLIQFLHKEEFKNQKEDVLFQFLDRYNNNLKIETDDKTICIGSLK